MAEASNNDVFEFPASATQETFWYMYQLDQESTAYTIPLSFRVSGDLDSKLLRKAVALVIDRHEILRTTYREDDEGTLTQVVLPSIEYSFEFDVLDDSNVEAREVTLTEIIDSECRKPICIDREPVLRMRLVRLAPDHHVFVLVVHHIAVDHAGIGIFLKEMSENYECLASNRSLSFEEPELQYADYVVWQKENLKTSGLGEMKEVWRNRLQGVSGVLELETTFPRPRRQSFSGFDRYFEFGSGVSNQIRKFCSSRGVSPYHVLLSCIKAVYQRYTRQSDVVVGTPFSDRNQDDQLEDVIGCFTNTLPLATEFHRDMTFDDLLGATKQVMMEAFENQTVPLEEIVKTLDLKRDPSRNPLFSGWVRFSGTADEFQSAWCERLKR